MKIPACCLLTNLCPETFGEARTPFRKFRDILHAPKKKIPIFFLFFRNDETFEVIYIIKYTCTSTIQVQRRKDIDLVLG